MKYTIGGHDKDLTSEQKAVRLKKAVKIAICSSHHRKEILKNLSKEEKSEAQTLLQALSKECEKDITFEALEQHLDMSKKLYKALKAEVAEIASSNDKMLGIGETTSWLSQLLSPIPFNVGAMVHSGIRGFFKFFACKNMGDKKFKEKHDEMGSIFNPIRDESGPDTNKDADEDKNKDADTHSEPPSPPAPPTETSQDDQDRLAVRSNPRGDVVPEVNSLYKRLHDGVSTSITNFCNLKTHQYDFPAIETALQEKGYKEDFKDFASVQDKNFLSRYVAALDRSDHSRNYVAIDIHHAALLRACQNDPDNQGLKEATQYFTAAVAMSTTYNNMGGDFEDMAVAGYRFENGLKPGDELPPKLDEWAKDQYLKEYKTKHKISDDKKLPKKVYEEAKAHIADGNNLKNYEQKYRQRFNLGANAKILDDFISEAPKGKAAEKYVTKSYKDILEEYGSAPFLVREGKKGAQGFTHFGSVIVEKNKDKTGYHVRIENPTAKHSIIYAIKPEGLDETLYKLHKVYMNGNPNNNLGEGVSVSEIAEKIIGLDNLDKDSRGTPKRQLQSGVQCGIHSSRRIIPEWVYEKAGFKDCDILGLVEPAAVPLAITEK